MMKKSGVLTGIGVVLILAVVVLGIEVSKLKKQVASFSNANWAPPIAHQMSPHLKKFSQMERDIYSYIRHMQKEMDMMFNSGFYSGQNRRYMNFAPGRGFLNLDIDMQEKADKYVIKVDMPGMEKSKIDVEVKGNSLVISGEKSEEAQSSKGSRYFKQERRFGSFARMITLPPDAQMDKITSKYERGVLTITIPKITSNNVVAGKKIMIQ